MKKDLLSEYEGERDDDECLFDKAHRLKRIIEKRGRCEGLKIAYSGGGNNMDNSCIHAARPLNFCRNSANRHTGESRYPVFSRPSGPRLSPG